MTASDGTPMDPTVSSPAELGEDAAPAHSWIATDIVAVLSEPPRLLRRLLRLRMEPR